MNKIFGLHAVSSALDNHPEYVLHVWITEQRRDKRIDELYTKLGKLGIVIEPCGKEQLDRLAGGGHHQGVVVALKTPPQRDEIALKSAIEASPSRPFFFLVLDQIQDPHNLGACLRTADAAGVSGVILPNAQTARLTPTVYKVASGAADTVAIYHVSNLARILNWMKDQGIWIIGSDAQAGDTLYSVDMKIPLALVIGSEGQGLRRLTSELCDYRVRLPMLGKVESLNLSVAAGILLYEVVRQRQG